MPAATAALQKAAEAREQVPLSDEDIRRFLPGAKIIKYSELSKYSNLFDLLPDIQSYCFILYEDSVNKGHWTVVCRPSDGVAEYFDSYGGPPDAPLRWTARDRRVGLGEGHPYLSILLGDALREEQIESAVYNKICYQKDGGGLIQINDCGRHCVLRILKMLEGFDLEQYYKWLKKQCQTLRMDFDAVVSTLIV